MDAATVDDSAHLGSDDSGLLGFRAFLESQRTNLLDGGARFYDLYGTSDCRHMAVGALDSKFFAVFISLLGVAEECPP